MAGGEEDDGEGLPAPAELNAAKLQARTFAAAGDPAAAEACYLPYFSRLAALDPSQALGRLKLPGAYELAARSLAREPAAGNWLATLRRAAGCPSVGDERVEEMEQMLFSRRPPKEAERIARLDALSDAVWITPGWWYAVHCRLFRAGAVSAAWAAKGGCARSVLASAGADLANARLRFAAAAWLGEAQAIGRTLDALGEFADARTLRAAAIEAAAALGDWSAVGSAGQNGGDDGFEARVRGAEIALVGPAPNTLRSGDEIDRFDLVARTGFFAGESFDAQRASIGGRADIAYYSKTQAAHGMGALAETARASPRTIFCLRARPHVAALVKAEPRALARFAQLSNVFWGRGYAMRHALVDLARAGAKRIKLFGVDFFLGAEIHYAGYDDTGGDQIRSYLTHDVFDTWRLMRSMRDAGLLDADAVLAPLLDGGEAAFAAALSERVRAIGGTRQAAD